MKALTKIGLVLSAVYVLFMMTEVGQGKIGPFDPIALVKNWRYYFSSEGEETLWADTIQEWIFLLWLIWGVSSLGWGASAIMLFDIVLLESARARDPDSGLGVSDMQSHGTGFLWAAWVFGRKPLYWSAIVGFLGNVIAFLAPWLPVDEAIGQTRSKGGRSLNDITDHLVHFSRMGRGFVLGALYYVGLKYVGLT